MELLQLKLENITLKKALLQLQFNGLEKDEAELLAKLEELKAPPAEEKLPNT